MLRYLLILLTCFSLSGCFCTKIRVCFTPQKNCAAKIIDEIDRSQKSIYIQAYTFTSKSIAKSLIMAKARGIDIKVILDETQVNSEYSVINELCEGEIPIWIDFKPAIAHNKVMIIDNKKVITGSFNLTYSAQARNAENLLIIQNNDQLVKKYVKNWKSRQSQSEIYAPTTKE